MPVLGSCVAPWRTDIELGRRDQIVRARLEENLLKFAELALLVGDSRLLRDLLEDPVHQVGLRLLDPEPLELGRDLPPVVGGVIDDVAQYYPRGQGRRPAAP